MIPIGQVSAENIDQREDNQLIDPHIIPDNPESTPFNTHQVVLIGQIAIPTVHITTAIPANPAVIFNIQASNSG